MRECATVGGAAGGRINFLLYGSGKSFAGSQTAMNIASKIDSLKIRLAAFRRRTVARMECHYCGFQPADRSAAGGRCPKCFGGAWEQPGRKPRIRTANGE
ncbi:MAG: hypothetical protein JWO87_3974 [Phycisphaerales bacterium]|nr:hypothetical protein [Phycisphaerales bacterium]